MVELSTNLLEQLEEYLEQIRPSFQRRDQIRWASVYLQGLLRPGTNKTIRSMARQACLPEDILATDIVQALQHFLNQSSWDEGKVWQRHRQLCQPAANEEGTWLALDLPFLKQGRHSVGVQRQYSSVLGRKTGCQIAMALFHISSAGIAPLGLHLYLPRSWIQDEARLRAAGVPREYQQVLTRGELVLRLLEQAQADGWQADLLLASPSLAADLSLREALSQRDLDYVIDTGPQGRAAGSAPAWMEGRSWQTSLDRSGWQAAEDRIQHSILQVASIHQALYEELGLDAFEGRSWRGFHHHACLVMLAYSFSQQAGG